jgi:hypothetical protein
MVLPSLVVDESNPPLGKPIDAPKCIDIIPSDYKSGYRRPTIIKLRTHSVLSDVLIV